MKPLLLRWTKRFVTKNPIIWHTVTEQKLKQVEVV